jgi:thymidylate synthase
MSLYDYLYINQCEDILDNGYSDKGQKVRTVYEDGSPAHTKSILNYQLKFDNIDREVPILTTKFVAWKWAIKELLWIWQMKSNVVQDLRDMGVTIWDEWELEDGTIGKAYGWQLAKEVRDGRDQVDNLIHELKTNPSSRRHITTLWDVDDVKDMALTPCVWNTHWQVQGKKLHLTVGIRSNDTVLGQPFNVFQYYVLQRMIAQVTGYELGTLTFNIDNAHIYLRHEELLEEQLNNEPLNAPKLWINPSITNFYDFTIDDFKLTDYNHHGKYNYEVAI